MVIIENHRIGCYDNNCHGECLPVVDSGDIIITGTDRIKTARLIAVRGALKLEVKGLRRSRGRSARILANEAMGTNIKTARATYEAFNAWLVETHGAQDRPL
jgi:hypothetical protein